MEAVRKIVIVGGGFAGIACALELEKIAGKNSRIQLISDKSHFEYHAALYRVVTGKSPFEVCVPLAEIFAGKRVEVIQDRIVEVDIDKQRLSGESSCGYTFDHLVLAMGSETSYFDTPGLPEWSFGFKSIHEALALKRHMHEIFMSAAQQEKEEQLDETRIVVAGGGPSGTEIAGELAVYVKDMASYHGIDPSMVTIELVQSPNRLVPMFEESVSRAVERRLRNLGVNIYLNRKLVKEEIEEIHLKDMSMNSKTVIWTAGVTGNVLYRQIKGLEIVKGNKVAVDRYLRAKGRKDVWIAGDGAAVEDSGMAWPAMVHGRTVAGNIYRAIRNKTLQHYQKAEFFAAVPVGPGWAVFIWRKIRLYGVLAWWMRRVLDLWVFTQFLPLGKALTAWRYGEVLSESCETCAPKVAG